MGNNTIHEEVYNMFDRKSSQQMAELYLQFVGKMYTNYKFEKGSFKQGIVLFERLKMLSNNANSYQTILSATDVMHNATLETKRVVKLLSYLGEMLCFWAIGEKSAVIKLQNEVRSIEFNMTWWERNGGNIKEVGGFIAGLAIAFAGGNPTGGKVVAAEGGKMGYSHYDELTKSETDFKHLKEAIVRINFR